MSQQIVPERVIGIGILSGMVAGLITGTGARIAMRIVAMAANRSPIFTVGGTFFILFIGFLGGLIIGFIISIISVLLTQYGIVKRYYPGPILKLSVRSNSDRILKMR